MAYSFFPPRQGLYDPRHEKDACGIGFLVDIKGRASTRIVQEGLKILNKMDHRGATGAHPDVGDGAGIMLQLPHAYLEAITRPLGFALPAKGRYAVGMVFLPQEERDRAVCESLLNDAIAAGGQRLLGWRTVPTQTQTLGPHSRQTAPYVRQVFVEATPALEGIAFERKLFQIRRHAEKAVQARRFDEKFFICSFSARTLVYKGMLRVHQLGEFYPELSDPRLESAIALLHARFSTNTFPTWDRAHPGRVMIHNGEINTIRGNQNWMTARQSQLRSSLFGENPADLAALYPILQEDGSDSTMFDNVLEFLHLGGRTLPEAMLMMIPEAWDGNPKLSEARRAFYQYHAALMEPWDGPAAVAFTDGTLVGATLDRNGLRPARIWVTHDDLCVMASESGVLEVAPEQVAYKTRLQPGRIFVVDTARGEVISDEDVKRTAERKYHYAAWLKEHHLTLESLADPPAVHQPDHASCLRRQQVFGYSREDLRLILKPMAERGQEPIGSMGCDVPLAVLSDKPRLLFDYFKQNFAQVTNPPIDPIREALVMSLGAYLNREGNLLATHPQQEALLWLPSPLLTNYELEKLRHVRAGGFRAKTLPMLFPTKGDGDPSTLETALNRLCEAAEEAVSAGHQILILSDRGVDAHWVPMPSLLAAAAVHHHLIACGQRSRVGLVVESGEVREVHHCALLVGYGVNAMNPYLALETIVNDKTPFRATHDEQVPAPVARFIRAMNQGLLKVMSKMGISTVQSYHGAQIFEALGLSRALVERFFKGTPTRIEGVGLEALAADALARHAQGYPREGESSPYLNEGGLYQYRRRGEHHQLNPRTIRHLQSAVRSGSQGEYDAYAELINAQNEKLGTLRGLLRFKGGTPIPLDEVEAAASIAQRFCTGAMSLGALSREAHETLAIAMNRLGGKSNSGEGGEDPRRFVPDPNGDRRISKIKQVASGRFGVSSHYLVNAEELQIKMAQGAKPGEGGQLPGHKVDAYIGKIRFTTPGVGLISPPPHHDIYSIEDLKQLIFDLKNANPWAAISVKLVAESGVGTVAAGVAKAKADLVLISGHDGGTGASPLSSIQHAGMPWEIGLAETQQTLVLNALRGRIRVQTDGQLKTGRDVVVAALLGAEEFGFSTAPLVAMGCVMMRVCHLNTCPVGVATQDPRLRAMFPGSPEHVTRFFLFVAEEARRLMAELGFRTIAEMVGRVDRLQPEEAIAHWKACGLDLTPLLHTPAGDDQAPRHQVTEQDHGIARVLDHQLIAKARPALERREAVHITTAVSNADLTTGTMLGAELSRRHGAEGLPEDTIRVLLHGSAGQSLGAYLPAGITLDLHGDANDYAGKGLSGGKLILHPPQGSTFAPETNIIAGNVALYGATSGEAYFGGVCGERFAVRNSGALAVVEGVGDHACEYMTGGRVIVLGSTGRNFAAGMSGGLAYVWDAQGEFTSQCNSGMVDLDPLTAEDQRFLQRVIAQHRQLSGSPRAEGILERWESEKQRFIKVFPVDYKRILAETEQKTA